MGRSQYRDIKPCTCCSSVCSIVPRTSAPERTNRQAASISERVSPTKWNNSVRTASEVSKGRRNCWNASTQESCHRSVLSSSARIAPASMSALAGIAPLEAPADRLAGCFGAPGIEACEHAQATRGSGAKFSLRLVIRSIRIALLQPIADGHFEDGRYRHFAEIRFPLQVRLKLFR